MSRIVAALFLMVGLLLLMIGFYANELAIIEQILRGYVVATP